jgi:hypothetical protein
VTFPKYLHTIGLIILLLVTDITEFWMYLIFIFQLDSLLVIYFFMSVNDELKKEVKGNTVVCLVSQDWL